MPSTHSKASGRSMLAAAFEAPLLLMTTAGLGWLFSDAAAVERSVSIGLILGLLVPFSMVAAAAVARRIGSHCLHMAVYMVVGGGIGLVAGAQVDFGPLGLVGLAAWCSTLPVFSVDGAVTRAAVATWSYTGMFIGCNLGMLMSNLAYRQDPFSRRLLPVRYLFCNGWMLVGMLLAESAWPNAAFLVSAAFAATGMVAVMFAAMTAGMWLGWWSVDWMVQSRSAGERTNTLIRKTITSATMGGRVN